MSSGLLTEELGTTRMKQGTIMKESLGFVGVQDYYLICKHGIRCLLNISKTPYDPNAFELESSLLV